MSVAGSFIRVTGKESAVFAAASVFSLPSIIVQTFFIEVRLLILDTKDCQDLRLVDFIVRLVLARMIWRLSILAEVGDVFTFRAAFLLLRIEFSLCVTEASSPPCGKWWNFTSYPRRRLCWAESLGLWQTMNAVWTSSVLFKVSKRFNHGCMRVQHCVSSIFAYLWEIVKYHLLP